jgi:hypothetical protein
MIRNIFDQAVTDELIARIGRLSAQSQPQWGKMNVAQMLAHCCVTYEFIFDNKHPKPGAIKQWLLRLFIKPSVVNEKPYRKSTPTAPEFKVSSQQDFNLQQARLTEYLLKTQSLGEKHFEGKSSRSFGKLSAREWNNMLYKHLDHHLTQFGV